MNQQTLSMETNQQPNPCTETISSFLNPTKSSPSIDDSSDDHDEASFIVMDPRMPPSKRFINIRVSTDRLGFDFPELQSPLAFVHADELICNGLVVPIFVKDLKMDRFINDIDVKQHDHRLSNNASFSSSSTCYKSVKFWDRVCCMYWRSCQRFCKRFCHRDLNLLWMRFFCYVVNNKKKKWNHQFGNDNFDSARICRSKRWSTCSTATSPSVCDSESSIYEAVLHCKRTHGVQVEEVIINYE